MKKRLLNFVLKRLDWHQVGLAAVNFLLAKLKKSKAGSERRELVAKLLALDNVIHAAAQAVADLNVDKAELAEIELALGQLVKAFDKR